MHREKHLAVAGPVGKSQTHVHVANVSFRHSADVQKKSNVYQKFK